MNDFSFKLKFFHNSTAPFILVSRSISVFFLQIPFCGDISYILVVDARSTPPRTHPPKKNSREYEKVHFTYLLLCCVFWPGRQQPAPDRESRKIVHHQYLQCAMSYHSWITILKFFAPPEGGLEVCSMWHMQNATKKREEWSIIHYNYDAIHLCVYPFHVFLADFTTSAGPTFLFFFGLKTFFLCCLRCARNTQKNEGNIFLVL